MTIENRFEFFGLPIPGMRREMEPDMKMGLGFRWKMPPYLNFEPISTIIAQDEDTVAINILSSGDTVTLTREQINERKIKSPSIIGLRSVFRWKPTEQS